MLLCILMLQLPASLMPICTGTYRHAAHMCVYIYISQMIDFQVHACMHIHTYVYTHGLSPIFKHYQGFNESSKRIIYTSTQICFVKPNSLWSNLYACTYVCTKVYVLPPPQSVCATPPPHPRCMSYPSPPPPQSAIGKKGAVRRRSSMF